MSSPDRGAAPAAPWDPGLRDAIASQLGAAIDMLENAVRACPDDLWGDTRREPQFWYLTFHTLFWLDLYLSGAVEGFAPPDPFTLDELDPAGVMPERVYGKDELLRYLAHGRARCRATLAVLTPEAAARRCAFGWGAPSFLELLLYNLRHVQHHAGQLNLLLRQATNAAPRWVGSAGTGA